MPTIRELNALSWMSRRLPSRVIFQLFVVLAVIVSLGLVQVDAQSR